MALRQVYPIEKATGLLKVPLSDFSDGIVDLLDLVDARAENQADEQNTVTITYNTILLILQYIDMSRISYLESSTSPRFDGPTSRFGSSEPCRRCESWR